MSYLIPATLAWIVAQGSKHIFRLMGRNRRVFRGASKRWFLPSGGMPSAHSAVVSSFATYVGLVDGVDSGLFALSLLLAMIVVYDSMRVRYASGRQGELLNTLLVDLKSKLSPVRVAHGHTAFEVVAGIAVGVTISLVVFFTTR